jgi:plasmid stability protein
MQALEIGVKQRQLLRVDDRDFAIVFPLPIVAELEETLGRSMKIPADWLRIKTAEVRDILEAGLKTYHPDEAAATADAVSKGLDPEQIETVIAALCAAACPKAMAHLEKEIEKARARARKGLALPNAQSADAS